MKSILLLVLLASMAVLYPNYSSAAYRIKANAALPLATIATDRNDSPNVAQPTMPRPDKKRRYMPTACFFLSFGAAIFAAIPFVAPFILETPLILAPLCVVCGLLAMVLGFTAVRSRRLCGLKPVSGFAIFFGLLSTVAGLILLPAYLAN
jgi:hypothetical protein